MTVADSAPASSRRKGSLLQRLMAAGTVGLLLAAGLLLADWLRAREQVGAGLNATLTEARGQGLEDVPESAFDPRMDGWMPGTVGFSQPRLTSFGDDRALFSAGPSLAPPEEVFGAVVARMERGVTEEAARRALAMGPSAMAALRMQVTAGLFPGGAFLLRLAPRLDEVQAGRLRLEPGGVMLAWQVAAERWEYVLFYFPDGLDLDAFIRRFGAPERALEPLGPVARHYLEPTLQLDPAAWGTPDAAGPRTVICKARGTPREAISQATRELEERGWLLVPPRGAEDGSMAVLEGPGGSIWIATSEPEVTGGLVTVLFGAS